MWIDPSETDVATIKILQPESLPIFQKYQDLQSAIISGKARILEVDPYASLLRSEKSIPEKYRQRRDKAWNAIEPLVQDQTGQIFYSYGRGKLLNEREKQTGITKKTIYKFLRRFWQRGLTKNALLPAYDKCGAKGKEREGSERKRGRPSKLTKVNKLPTGININVAIREKFNRGIRLFYEKTEGRTLSRCLSKNTGEIFS